MKILTLLFLGLVFESAGIVLIFPILSFIEIGGDISQFDSNSTIWGPIIALHRLIGVDIQLISLLFLALASFLLSGSFVYLKTVYIDELRFRALAASRKKYFEKIFQSKLSLIEDNAHGVLVNEIITDLERSPLTSYSVSLLAHLTHGHSSVRGYHFISVCSRNDNNRTAYNLIHCSVPLH